MNKFIPFFFIYILIFSFLNPIEPQENRNKKNLCLTEFSNFGSTENPKITALIYQILTNSFNTQKFIIKKISDRDISQKLSASKKSDCYFLIDGLFKKSNEQENLQLFVQVYNPDTGLMIDAFNITDEFASLKGLKLDPEESKESDNLRIQNLAKKLTILLMNNTKRQEKRDNINEFVISSKLNENRKFPISSGEAATEEAAKQVFNILQSQVTYSSTKTEKKTSEAPNIVSVISDKEILDYGRISLNDILYQLPGFSSSQINERRTVSSRGVYEGWNNNHMLVLQDGVQFNENFYGSALTWELTPLNMVKSVEVIRGPGSALYGSNAMNGVISLNTYSGKDLNGNVKVRARLGDYGTRIYDLLTGNTGKVFSYVASMNTFDTNGNNVYGYDGSERTDDFGFLKKFTHKDERNNYSLMLKLEGEGILKGFSAQYNRQYWRYETFNGWLQNVPDVKDQISESRDVTVLKYSKSITDKLSHEYVLKYSPGTWKYNIRLYPNDPNNFPSGVTENLNTGFDSTFGRGQLTYIFDNGGSFVTGIETTRMVYRGDKEHSSDVDMNLMGTGESNTGNIIRPLNPYMEWIVNKPIEKIAGFAQITSGKIIEKKIEITLGVRYDESAMHFRGIDNPNKDIAYPTYTSIDPITMYYFIKIIPTKYLGPPFVPNEKKTYRKTSPRVGLVFFATDRLTFKAMAGSAFREPSAGELFGVNTWVGGSNNPRKISPEVIKTYEVAADWFATKFMNLRVNGFQTRTENMIDYSDTSNTIINAYTLGTKGIETEALFSFKNISAFANYSKFYRFVDNNLKPSSAKHPNEVTNAPASSANLGITAKTENFSGSISFQRQGQVSRKMSDLGPIDPNTGILQENIYSNPYSYPVYRPKKVEPWTNINLRMEVKLFEEVFLAVFVSNSLNQHQYLLQRGVYPFDYQRERRRVMIDIRATF